MRSSPDTDPFKPVAFGKYELVDLIGSGGMAEIYLARSYGAEGLHKTLVIKRILSKFSTNERFIEMFIDEAKIAMQLNHPNIVQIYDFGKFDDDFYLAMEYVEGLNLAQVLSLCARAGRPLSVGEAVYTAAEVARGLHYAHQREDEYGVPLAIVHRDISPQNILISGDGTVKIVDFGIARASSVAQDQPNIVKGKFAYMSPEQADGQPVDARSDLFSLGAVLFEMVCGRALFRGAGREETLSLVRSAVVPDIRALNPAVPAQLEHLLYKTLAQDVDGRYQSARELQVDLTRVLYGMGEIHDAMTLSAHVAQARQLAPLDPDEPSDAGGTAVTNVISAATARSSAAGTRTATLEAFIQTPVEAAVHLGESLRAAHAPEEAQITPSIRMIRERKEVVVVAGEVVGLREAGAGPTDVAQSAQALQEYRRIVDALAFKNEGLVYQVNEREFMIVLGLPISSENDAERAVRMATDLHEAVSGMGLGLDSPLQLAIGAAVADAFVARNTQQPAEFQWSFSATTEQRAVVLAQAAMPREVLVGEQVYRRVRRSYELEQVEPVEHCDADGRRFVLKPHRLVGRKSQRAQLEELRSSYRAFHGRELELRALKDAYRQSVLLGRSQGVLLTGAQGVGKSTLVEEFLAGLAAHDVRVVRGVITAVERDVPLGAMANLLTVMMQLGPRENLRQVREALQQQVQALFPHDDPAERELMLHSLGALFNIRGAGGQFRELDADERRARKYLSLTRLLLRLAAEKPVVLAIEDVQHLDESTLEFAAQFLNASHDAPAFFIATANLTQLDESLPVWQGFRNARHLRTEEIADLAPAPARALALDLLSLDGVDDERLIDEVLRRAGGNPLFIKEVIDLLRDRGVLTDSDAIGRLQASDEDPQWLPASVEGLIAARIDRLSVDPKMMLQRVALLGTTFTAAQAKLAFDGEDDADLLLEELVALNLLEHVEHPGGAGAQPGARGRTHEYRFCNHLTRDVAARSLLPEQAQALHLRIADYLVAQRNERSTAPHFAVDHAVIAAHYDAAGESEAAVHYYLLAAEDAFRHRGASECLRLCDKILTRAPSDEARVLRALMLREQALLELGQPAQRREALDQLHDWVMRAGTPAQQVEVLLRESRFLYDEGDFARAREQLEHARELIARSSDSPEEAEVALADCLQIKILILMREGKRPRARELVERAIEIYKKAGGGASLLGLAKCYNMLGVILRQSGEPQQAFAAYEEALKYAEQGDFGKQMRQLLINTGIALAHAGEFSEALARFERALAQCHRLGHRSDEASVLVNLGHTYLMVGREQEAIDTIRRGIQLARKIDDMDIIADGLISLGVCYLETGALEAAERVLHEGLRLADSIPNAYLGIHATLSLAAVQLANSYQKRHSTQPEQSPPEVDEQGARLALLQAEDALERSQAAQMRWGMAAANSLLARALHRLGRHEECLEKSSAAVALLDDAGTYGSEAILYFHVQFLQADDARRAERDAVLARARAYVTYRRDLLADDAARAQFMARPINQRIMAAAFSDAQRVPRDDDGAHSADE